MIKNFETYLRELRQTPLDEQTEHTGRAALEALLNDFADKAPGRGIKPNFRGFSLSIVQYQAVSGSIRV